MCRRQGEFCKTCLGNDCNAKVSFQNCRACNSTTNVNCIRSPGSFASTQCRNYLDECYVHVENDVVTRGCLQNSPRPVQDECEKSNTDMCTSCSNGSNCNNRIVDGEFCLTCDSENDINCRGNLNFTMRTQCPLSVTPRGCYRFDDSGK